MISQQSEGFFVCDSVLQNLRNDVQTRKWSLALEWRRARVFRDAREEKGKKRSSRACLSSYARVQLALYFTPVPAAQGNAEKDSGGERKSWMEVYTAGASNIRRRSIAC